MTIHTRQQCGFPCFYCHNMRNSVLKKVKHIFMRKIKEGIAIKSVSRKDRVFILILIVLALAVSGQASAENLSSPWKAALHSDFSIPQKGCALVIDLDILKMTVYIDGEIYKTFPCSGGKDSSPSPVGVWKVVNKSNWGEGFGGSWIGLNVPWGKYGIHGTLKPWLIGVHNVSHGCIRMRDSDVGEVKKLVSIGSYVYIKQDSLSFRPMKNGMFGSDVLFVQKMLQAQGYYSGRLDGKFGNGLETSVRKFQGDHLMYVDGVVGRRTYMRMYELTE
jgi:hypothetical protein